MQWLNMDLRLRVALKSDGDMSSNRSTTEARSNKVHHLHIFRNVCTLRGSELFGCVELEAFAWLYVVRNRWSQRLCLPWSLSFDMQMGSSQRMSDAVVCVSCVRGQSKHSP